MIKITDEIFKEYLEFQKEAWEEVGIAQQKYQQKMMEFARRFGDPEEFSNALYRFDREMYECQHEGENGKSCSKCGQLI